jgi:hypothetical protein
MYTSVVRVLLILGWLAVIAQQPPPLVPAGRASIAGRVVESGSNRPLPDTILTLQSVVNRAELRTATDPDGRYLFEGIGAGAYRLTAALDGYAAHTWSDLDAYVMPNGVRATFGQVTLDVSEGQLRTGVNFALERGGQLAGRVTSADGKAAKDVMVMAIPIREEQRVVPGAGQARTNDRGDYAIRNLRPGMYHVSALYLDPDRPRALTGAGTRATYFPGTHAVEEATALRVTGGGETGNVDIRLAPDHLFRIAGHVLRGSSEDTIEAHLLSGEHSIRTVRIAEDGAFEITHVAQGRHVLWARARTPQGSEAAWTTIELASDLTGLVLPMLPTAQLRGRVVSSDGLAFSASGYQIIAHLADANGRRMDALPRDRNDILAGGTFELRDVFGHRSLGLSGNEWDVDRVLVGKSVVETLTFHGGERLDDLVVVVKPRQR